MYNICWAGAILEYTYGDWGRDGQRFRHIQEGELRPVDSRRTQFQLTLRIHHVNSAMVSVSAHLPSVLFDHFLRRA